MRIIVYMLMAATLANVLATTYRLRTHASLAIAIAVVATLAVVAWGISRRRDPVTHNVLVLWMVALLAAIFGGRALVP